jgi:hypothetical protein
MSQIFYSQIDFNLQDELNARGVAGISDRSEAALRYMTEKIANVSVTAYEGNKRDKNKIVHVLGGRTVIGPAYQPGGPDGFLTDKTYTLEEARWVTNANSVSNSANITATISSSKSEVTNRSKRLPPFITQASIQVNDNSKGTTNKATINITIPDPGRDLNYMESIYARPGRYCLVRIEHPDSALLSFPYTGGMLTPSALPNRKLIKERYPEADQEYDELRKMNKLQFEGLITAFEYSYNQDGSIAMTVYILGTSQTYTDMTMIMQTTEFSTTGSNTKIENDPNTVQDASTFYSELYKEVESLYNINVAKGKGVPPEQIPDPYYAFGLKEDDPAFEGNVNYPGWYIFNYTTIQNNVKHYITLNYLINYINVKVLSKLALTVDRPAIYCDAANGMFSNYYPNLCSSDPENIILASDGSSITGQQNTDYFGTTPYLNNSNKLQQAGKKFPWFYKYEPLNDNEQFEPIYRNLGVPGNMFISLDLIKTIQTDLTKTDTNTFNVGAFLSELSRRISAATGGAILMKLITDPENQTLLYYRDINWFKGTPVQPYNLPMYATHPYGSVVREFKLSSRLPSSVQNLMYSINSSNKVTESQLGPYISFMYNNGTSVRTPPGDGSVSNSNYAIQSGTIETTTYGGGKELTERLAKEYFDFHVKYRDELIKAREDYGKDPLNMQKLAAVQVALTKHMQYPFPTIEQTNQVSAPTFPIEAEFTIDGINGLRYGDVLDFPALPSKYQTNATFTIKGINHSVSTTGEWTTTVSCLMRPKFD